MPSPRQMRIPSSALQMIGLSFYTGTTVDLRGLGRIHTLFGTGVVVSLTPYGLAPAPKAKLAQQARMRSWRSHA
jgi:hypothetical protein